MKEWFEGFEFDYAPDDGEHKQKIIDAVNGNAADRVLVVGATRLFTEADCSQFRRHALLVNSRCSLSWLVEATARIRCSADPFVLISNIPADIAPPTVHWMEMPFHCHRSYATPEGTSLAIIGKDVSAGLTVIFDSIHETSYYATVLRSQNCPPQNTLSCKVIANDRLILFDEQSVLKGATDPETRTRILIKGSEDLERWIHKNGRSAGILTR